jgi:hypothetical protein
VRLSEWNRHCEFSLVIASHIGRYTVKGEVLAEGGDPVPRPLISAVTTGVMRPAYDHLEGALRRPGQALPDVVTTVITIRRADPKA